MADKSRRVCGETSIDGTAQVARTSCLWCWKRQTLEKSWVLAWPRSSKWKASGCLHVTHTNTNTNTPQLDINTGETVVAGSTMLQSGCDREDTKTCSTADRTAFKFEWDCKEKQMALT